MDSGGRRAVILLSALTACSCAHPRPQAPEIAPAAVSAPSSRPVIVPEALPEPLWTAAAAVTGGQFYVFGGLNGGAWQNSVLRLDPRGGHWETLAHMAHRRSVPAAGLVGESIVVSGGSVLSGNGITSRSTEIYDRASNSWRKGPTMRRARQGHALVSVGGVLFAVGGCDNRGLPVLTVEALRNGRWANVGRSPISRISSAIVGLDGLIYTIGGRDDRSRTRDTRAYDPATRRWETLPAMPTVREGAGAAVVDGKIYVIGGDTDNGRPLPTVEVYDPRERVWSSAPDMPTPRFGAAVGALDGLIYVAGGYDGRQSLRTVEVYDPETRRWR